MRVTISGVKVSISGYFKTWTVDHGLDRELDYGPNSAGPPHAHISFSHVRFLYVDLTAKLALLCQLVHRPPFDMFNTRVHF